MFSKPSYDEYKNQLDIFLKSIYTDPNCSKIQKWRHICSLFSQYIPAELKASFNKFVKNREQIQAGRYNLHLDEFIGFMENFYFLLSQQNSRFKLTDSQKQKILHSLNEIFGIAQVCEPGIVTRLNEILFEYRSDINWVTCELAKSRYRIIQMLSADYNQHHHIQPGYTIHTLMHMSQLASEMNLGVEPEAQIHDAYLDVGSTDGMTSYFNNNILYKLESYELDYLDGLIAHLWSVYLAEHANKFEKNGNGQIIFEYKFENGKSIKSENSKIFENFLDTYFGQEIDRDRFYTQLDELGTIFQLVEEVDFKSALRDALIEKLELERFIIPLQKISSENIDEIRLLCIDKTHEELSKKFLLLTTNQDDFYKNFKRYLKEYQNVILNYPDVIINFLVSNTEIWDYLPLDLKNDSVFLKKLIKKISEQSDLSFHELSFEVLKINPEFFHEFSRAKQDLLRIRMNLMSPTEVESFCHLANVDAHINPRVSILSKNLKTIWQKKQISLEELSSHIGLFTPKQLLQYLKTNQVKVQGVSIKALECFDAALQDFDSQYNQLWKNHGYLKLKNHVKGLSVPENSQNVYSLNFYKTQAKKAIEKNSSWLNALIEFQQMIPANDLAFSQINTFKKHMQMLLELSIQIAKISYQFAKKMLHLYYSLLIFSLILSFNEFIAGLVYFAFCHMYSMWFSVFAFLAFAQILKNVFNISNLTSLERLFLFLQIIATFLLPIAPEFFIFLNGFTLIREIVTYLVIGISNLISKPLTRIDIDIFLVNLCDYYMIGQEILYKSFYDFAKFIFNNLFVNVPALIFAFFHSTFNRVYSTFIDNFKMNNDFQSVKEKIEANIWRLESIDDVSAQQKSKLLRQIWNSIQSDALDLKVALNKSYPVSFKGQVYQLSFNQVSELKRTQGQDINLEKETSRNSFFNNSTSKKLLVDLDLESKVMFCA